MQRHLSPSLIFWRESVNTLPSKNVVVLYRCYSSYSSPVPPLSQYLRALKPWLLQIAEFALSPPDIHCFEFHRYRLFSRPLFSFKSKNENILPTSQKTESGEPPCCGSSRVEAGVQTQMPPHHPLFTRLPFLISLVSGTPCDAHVYYLPDQIRGRYLDLGRIYYLDASPFAELFLVIMSPTLMSQFQMARWLASFQNILGFARLCVPLQETMIWS